MPSSSATAAASTLGIRLVSLLLTAVAAKIIEEVRRLAGADDELQHQNGEHLNDHLFMTFKFVRA